MTEQARSGLRILTLQACHQLGRGHHLVNRANALAAAPDVLPGFLRTAAKVHLAGVGLWQVVRVQTGSANGWRQEVAMYAGKQIAVDHSTIACL